MKRISIFTAARSDFGILKNIILKIEKDKRFNLDLIVNSAHKSQKFGKTVSEINEIIVKNKIILKFKYGKSNPENIIKYFNSITEEISSYILKKKPDAFIIMGDRYEMLACAFSCIQFQIPIIHFCGGSITLGSLDDIYRDNISRMANLHLVETKYHRRRLTQLGIKKNIKIVGAPALENLNMLTNNSFFELIKKYKIRINRNKKLIITCFHPETNISLSNNIINLKKLIYFLKMTNENVVFTYPNADNGYNDYIKLIKSNLRKKKNCSIIENLGIKNYYTLLKNSDVMLGNSSSGIIESASFKIPVINLGNRQKNRFANKNVINSSFEYRDIRKSFKDIQSEKFLNQIRNLKNFYFQNNCSKNSIDIIHKFLTRYSS